MAAYNKARLRDLNTLGWMFAALFFYFTAILSEKGPFYAPVHNVNFLRGRVGRAEACDEDRLRNIVHIRQNTKSNCPDRTPWWLHFAGNMSDGRQQPLVHINIGCNKGVDFLAALHDLSGDDVYSPTAYLERLQRDGISFPDQGACGQLRNTAQRTRPILRSPRKVMGYCIEPGNRTFQVLKQGMKDLEGQGRVFLGQYVAGSSPGTAFFPDVEPGIEYQSFSKTDGVPIPVLTLDDYAESMGIDHIDLLSIDTEGNDPHVLYGAVNLLTSGIVRIVEFEVHAVGQWTVSRVDNIVSMLDNAAFTCYWHLNGPHPLLRATGCMAEELESNNVKHWSNMVCVNRRERSLATLFEDMSYQTENSYM